MSFRGFLRPLSILCCVTICLFVRQRPVFEHGPLFLVTPKRNVVALVCGDVTLHLQSGRGYVSPIDPSFPYCRVLPNFLGLYFYLWRHWTDNLPDALVSQLFHTGCV